MAALAIIRSIGGLVFDAVLEEQHESSLEVTENPVETGVVVADHAYMKPERVTISAGVSDVSLRARVRDPYGNGVSRHREAFRLLQELQRSAEPFDVQTGLKLYRNMVCTNLRVQQNKDSASALMFQAELREVIITFTQSVIYPPRLTGATQQQAGKTKEKGEQQGKQVGTSQPAKRQSIAKSLKKAAGGG